MSLFKKPKRNFRQREARLNDSDNEDANEVGFPKISPKKKLTEKSKNSSNKKSNKISLLSFDNDEEEDCTDVFKVKKSSVSRRLEKMKYKEKKSREKSKVVREEPMQSKEDIIVRQTKPILVNKDVNCSENVEYFCDSDDNEPSRPDDPVRKALECGAIPDAAMIHAARKQRQQARELGGGSDFVSLEEPEDDKGSRLIRDDENDISDEEDRGRISFSVDKAEIERAKVLEAFLEAQKQSEELEEDDQRVDDELQKWEEEQIRKGVSLAQMQSEVKYQNQPNSSTSENYYEASRQPGYAQFYPSTIDTPKVINIKIPTTPLEEITTEMIKLRLENRLQSLKEVNRAHMLEMDKLQDDLISSQSLIGDLENGGPKIASKFSFYQEMRGYVTDLVECLNEKVVVINALEERMHKLLADRSQNIVKRRQQDCKDQAEEFTVVNKSQVNIQPITDPEKRRRMAEREGRRVRRRRNRENNIRTCQKHYEGLSSDDELERTVIEDFNQTMEIILRDSNLIFDDVNEGFGNLIGIQKWFEKWKLLYPETYSEAYISVCLPKLFGPFVRVELLSWNPLEQVRNIETMLWYRSLLSYGCFEDSKFDENDSDNDLIPLIVEKIVLPKLTALVTRVWDPLSTSQTTRLINLINRLCEDYPSVNDTSACTKNLLKAVVNRIKKTLEDDVFVPLYSRQLLESRTFNGLPFFQRQLWSCIKLLKNILMWTSIIADQPLLELSINGLLNRYMILGLQNSPINLESLEKAKMITSTFPRSWFKESICDDDKSMPQLSMFLRYLKSTIEYLCKDRSSALGESMNSKEYLKEILKIMILIGEREQAQAISKQYSYL